MTASVSGIAQGVTFTATAIDPPRPTTLEYRRGNGQSGEINQRLANPLVVRVLDQHSAVLSGITVNFSVSPSGSLSSQGPTTDANGEASTELTLGSTTGKYIITASVSGLSSVTFVATATNNSGRSNGGNNDGNSGKNDGNNDGNSGNNGGNNDGNSGKNGGNNDGNSGNNGGNNGGNGGNNGGLAGNSHLFFTQNSPVDVEGWLVQIYYPENYKGPRGLGEGALGGTSGPTPGESPYGFTVSVNNNDGKITQFAQTAGPCDDYDGDGEYDFPCNANFDHPSDEPGSVYSVQIEIETTKKKLTFHVAWDQSAANWNGTPASNTTYTLDADINMSGDDPHHTSQGN